MAIDAGRSIGVTIVGGDHVTFVDTVSKRRFSPEKMLKINLAESPEMFCDIYCLEPGQHQKPHKHEGAAKFYYVIEGCGQFTIGHRIETLGAGGLAFARAGETHGVENTSGGRLVVLVAMAPNPNVPQIA